MSWTVNVGFKIQYLVIQLKLFTAIGKILLLLLPTSK